MYTGIRIKSFKISILILNNYDWKYIIILIIINKNL